MTKHGSAALQDQEGRVESRYVLEGYEGRGLPTSSPDGAG
jgi:hypothetical protein